MSTLASKPVADAVDVKVHRRRTDRHARRWSPRFRAARMVSASPSCHRKTACELETYWSRHRNSLGRCDEDISVRSLLVRIRLELIIYWSEEEKFPRQLYGEALELFAGNRGRTNHGGSLNFILPRAAVLTGAQQASTSSRTKCNRITFRVFLRRNGNSPRRGPVAEGCPTSPPQ